MDRYLVKEVLDPASIAFSLMLKNRHLTLLWLGVSLSQVNVSGVGGFEMKASAIAILLCLGAMPALAQTAITARPLPSVPPTVRPGPAPLIGLGIPVALAVSGVLVGAKLVRRKRQAAGDR
jgi:hypothetical protein